MYHNASPFMHDTSRLKYEPPDRQNTADMTCNNKEQLLHHYYSIEKLCGSAPGHLKNAYNTYIFLMFQVFLNEIWLVLAVCIVLFQSSEAQKGEGKIF